MSNQKMGGCKKRRRQKRTSSGCRKAQAGINRCRRPQKVTGTYPQEMRKIDDMPIDESNMMTHKERFKSLPKKVRKAVYGITKYLY